MMKRKFYLFTLLACLGVLISCDKNDIEFESQFDKSYKTWLEFKQLSEDTYGYAVLGGSWSGEAWVTEIDVVKGKVVRRIFTLVEEPFTEEGADKEPLERWVEEGNEVGIHAHATAFAPITLDEVYELARTQWLIKGKDRETVFETENDGMISLCGYNPRGCQDDCFVGVRIVGIDMLLRDLSAVVE